ncbi:hypothetical protein [Hyphomonas sp. UBA4494]|jgi:xanthine/CO dehydrogenase XdhC/CoxF family maturation factor|uniref:hypothetical protein n=1 Tax=Hyphomonas sp. UBA4494 TaxID=1946631 RepID=UPI0025C3C8A8|nr:hypothetical protein [Hyphomonas sp. UBA4494]
MTAHSPPTFTCIICQFVRGRFYHERSGPDKARPPVCTGCESEYAPRIREGAFGDRRIIQQGLALAEALRCEAAIMEWPPEWRKGYNAPA